MSRVYSDINKWISELTYSHYIFTEIGFTLMLGSISLTWFKNACRRAEYFWHSNRNFALIHIGDNLFPLSTWSTWYRPISIISLRLLILNFTKFRLSLKCLNWCKIFFLKNFVKLKYSNFFEFSRMCRQNDVYFSFILFVSLSKE